MKRDFVVVKVNKTEKKKPEQKKKKREASPPVKRKEKKTNKVTKRGIKTSTDLICSKCKKKNEVDNLQSNYFQDKKGRILLIATCIYCKNEIVQQTNF